MRDFFRYSIHLCRKEKTHKIEMWKVLVERWLFSLSVFL